MEEVKRSSQCSTKRGAEETEMGRFFKALEELQERNCREAKGEQVGRMFLEVDNQRVGWRARFQLRNFPDVVAEEGVDELTFDTSNI